MMHWTLHGISLRAAVGHVVLLQPQVHLDVKVDDLDVAEATLLDLGATRLPGEIHSSALAAIVAGIRGQGPATRPESGTPPPFNGNPRGCWRRLSFAKEVRAGGGCQRRPTRSPTSVRDETPSFRRMFET
jgi:hypothetical protein